METGAKARAGDAVADRLVANHREFLRFLEPRVGNRALAEEILQAAFVRTLEKAAEIRDSESAVAWFYRLLRNAVVDHYRRAATEKRTLEREATVAEAIVDPEMRRIICACLHTLLPNLKPEYAEMIRRVDLDGTPVAEVASLLGITTNNATVRLHRARQALKRELERSCATCATHECLDCRCGSRPSAGA